MKDVGANPGVSAGFAWLFSKFTESPQRIPKTELRSQFRIENDECNRDDTLVEAGALENSGPSVCTISTAVSVGGQSISAGIVVPQHLKASWSRGAGGAVNLSLQGRPFEERPYLGISNNYLQEAWGGIISDVQFNKTSSLIVTENGCIRYDY